MQFIYSIETEAGHHVNENTTAKQNDRQTEHNRINGLTNNERDKDRGISQNKTGYQYAQGLPTFMASFGAYTSCGYQPEDQ